MVSERAASGIDWHLVGGACAGGPGTWTSVPGVCGFPWWKGHCCDIWCLARVSAILGTGFDFLFLLFVLFVDRAGAAAFLPDDRDVCEYVCDTAVCMADKGDRAGLWTDLLRCIETIT